MADRPLSKPLPADLPEDWTSGQIVAPMGADAGLSKQHGYNYLMAAVNAAQRAANAINESFDTISGKRTCRVSVGTSAAGWSQADCDYLCDGTDDQEELVSAINDVYEKGGGEIAVLSGNYNLTGEIDIRDKAGALSITGEPGATVFRMGPGVKVYFYSGEEESICAISFSGIMFDGSSSEETAFINATGVSAAIRNCTLRDVAMSVSDSDSRGSFAFQDNVIEYKGTPDGNVIFVNGSFPAGCVLSGNRFSVNTGEVQIGSGFNFLGVQVIDSFGTAGTTPIAVVAGNTLSAQGASKAKVYITGEVVLSGNCFVNTSVSTSSIAVGNTIENGDIDINGKGAAVGNTITNGNIFVMGEALASGNVISVEDQESGVGISIGRFGTNTDASPSVTGNYISGGNIGISFMKNNAPIPDVSCALVTGNRIWGCNVPIQIEANWSRCMVTNNMFPEGQSVVDKGEDNIIRGNSDDPSGGSGGGTAAGVASFKGRTGAVVPQSGDYTAAMVGAIPAGTVTAVQAVTQAQYDALSAKGATTLYLIKE